MFRRGGCRTTCDAPSLVVVDYGAAKSLGGNPLFLAMFGLMAARQGWKPRGRCRLLHAHLAAVAALCEGLNDPFPRSKRLAKSPAVSMW